MYVCVCVYRYLQNYMNIKGSKCDIQKHPEIEKKLDSRKEQMDVVSVVRETWGKVTLTVQSIIKISYLILRSTA